LRKRFFFLTLFQTPEGGEKRANLPLSHSGMSFGENHLFLFICRQVTEEEREGKKQSTIYLIWSQVREGKRGAVFPPICKEEEKRSIFFLISYRG